MSKIARVKFIRDKEPNIKALTAENKVLDGALYVATDTGTLWMGISSSSLIQIKDNINTNTTYNLTKSGSTITLNGSDGSTFNVTDSNTVYGNATVSAAGLMSAADKAKLDGIAAGSNHVTVDSTLSANSTNPVQNKVIKSALDGKSNIGHTHVKADITDFPTSMPASDVPVWAKAATKPSYSKAEVGLGNVDNTADANKSVKYATSAGSASTAITANRVANMGDAIANAARHVWFSDSETETARVSNDNFKYNPSGNLLTTNISGNAATASSVSWGNVSGKPSSFTPSSHTHDDRYYTESEINTKLNAKANSSHTHTKSQITDFPTSMPASDVYPWAKQSSKPSYTISEVSGNLPASRINGTIAAANLPSYVDDVLEYASFSRFPTAGESGKIYTALDTNKIYRWSGSAYVVISETVALGTTHSSAGYGDESRAAYNHSTKTSGNPHHVTKADVGLGSVDNTADSAKSVKYATSAGSVAWSNVSGKPSSMPASDVYSWAKQPSKPSYTASEVGAAPASHSHSYLPLSGGTMSGRILRGAGGSWISARNNAIAFGTTANRDAYNPVVGQKTTNGAWTVGSLTGDERLVFSYDTDTNFNAGNNSTNKTFLPIGGGSQEIITSATIGSQSVSHANTAGSVAWGNVTGRPTIPSVGNGTVTITQNGATKGSFTLNQSGNATIALTDNNTVYSLPAATSSTLGGVKVGSNITNSSGTISLTKANITSALGYTPPTSDTNTWRPEEVIISSTQPSASTCKLWIKI